MPVPFALISSSEITAEEFLAVLREAGGAIENAAALAGRVSLHDKHVWVSLDNRLLKEYEADEMVLVTQKLEGPPQSHILLDVSRTEGSEQLAVEFACVCARKWPCVVYNVQDKVWSAAELLKLRNHHGGFEE